MEPYYNYDYGEFGNGFGNGFGGGFDGSDFMAVFAMFLGLMVIFMLLSGAVSVVMYILRSIGLYKLSENRGMSGAALAWIPFIGFYRIGSIADDTIARNGGKSYYRHILLIGGIVSMLSGIAGWFLTALSRPLFSQIFRNPYIPDYYNNDYFAHHSGFFAFFGVNALLSVISIALYVFIIIALHKIYKAYRPASATLWTILSAIFPFMQSIFPFILRNAVPADQWNTGGYYPMQNTMPNQNWQAPPPPQYPTYDQQQPVNGGYPPQNQVWQAPPSPADNSYQTPESFYQPPIAPNPPEPWEIENSTPEAPPQAPWEQNNNSNNN